MNESAPIWTAMPTPIGYVVYATNLMPKCVRGNVDNIRRLTKYLTETKAQELDSAIIAKFDLIEIPV